MGEGEYQVPATDRITDPDIRIDDGFVQNLHADIRMIRVFQSEDLHPLRFIEEEEGAL